MLCAVTKDEYEMHVVRDIVQICHKSEEEVLRVMRKHRQDVLCEKGLMSWDNFDDCMCQELHHVNTTAMYFQVFPYSVESQYEYDTAQNR